MKLFNSINFQPLFQRTERFKSCYLGFVPLLILFGLLFIGCSDFVEVDPPRNTLISETVFDNPSTVESALANLYFEMREQGMISGSSGVTPALGIYTDELDYYGTSADYSQIYRHNVLAGNGLIMGWWSQAYYLIYSSNDIIKGVEGSGNLTDVEKRRFKGQALFVRAYVHSLLVALFGDVPYIKTTDYMENNKVTRSTENEIYDDIIVDLLEAQDLLRNMEPRSDQRVLPDMHTVNALLARIYLYTENWERAASLATALIEVFPLEEDLDQVFLKESSETIWQLKADEDNPKNTKEAAQLIIQGIPGQTYALTQDFLNAFEPDDLRFEHWIGSISDVENTITLHYPYKYKADLNESESLEYSILFRLTEQFLIRAEARAHMGNISGAQADLNMIRTRAGLPNTPALTEGDLLDAIVRERRIELFTEQGHRWFDLKRTGRANGVLGAIKSNWRATDVLLPLPESELETNPNLLPQNEGY
ncbi:RagB/SusD family nutrient uptake outer membrane protein [Flagellimonas sp. SN16]|uniref:RagB/SusD family nutrient uptake outer membrane protein n=1 Tax=Flagellimonas sp. SN16 TaxID=3415142 RepID=UPI003C5C7626